MANSHLAYPDLAVDKFSGRDTDQDAEAFICLIECKFIFLLSEPDLEHVIYHFRKKSVISSLIRGSKAQWYGSTAKNRTRLKWPLWDKN